MQARMTNPAYVLSGAMKGIGTLFQAIGEGGLAQDVAEMAGLRASQINGCGACVHGHVANLRKAGVSEERIAAVAAWRHAPFFSDAERAALKLTEAMTRLSDLSGESVPDALRGRGGRPLRREGTRRADPHRLGHQHVQPHQIDHPGARGHQLGLRRPPVRPRGPDP